MDADEESFADIPLTSAVIERTVIGALPELPLEVKAAAFAKERHSWEEEKQRLAEEHERLNRLQQQLERERAGMLGELAEERRRLDDLRENRLHELQKQVRVRVSYP